MRVLAPVTFLLLAFLSAPASAASYCQFSNGGTLVDGGTSTYNLKIVVSSVQRPTYPGQPNNRPWCVQYRTSLGGFSKSVITQQPKIGTATVGGYKIFYKGDKIGHDRFVVEHSWVGRNNEPFKGTLIYEVDVVGEPF